jgi:gas vesicle protein
MIKNSIKSILIIIFLSIAYSSTNLLYAQDTSTENKTINFKELEDQINLLFKEIDKLNKDFNSKISKQLESLIKENKNYLDELESEYKSKIKDESSKIESLKKSVDEILKIKNEELKIADNKIKDIEKNIKNLSSDEYIKNLKKNIKKELDEFRTTLIKSFEETLNIKVDTIN